MTSFLFKCLEQGVIGMLTLLTCYCIGIVTWAPVLPNPPIFQLVHFVPGRVALVLRVAWAGFNQSTAHLAQLNSSDGLVLPKGEKWRQNRFLPVPKKERIRCWEPPGEQLCCNSWSFRWQLKTRFLIQICVNFPSLLFPPLALQSLLAIST